jgi:polyisoprenyl-teichoic acid--peptidoglycan teichoic acid transferase
MPKENFNWASYNYGDQERRKRQLTLKIIFWAAIFVLASGIIYGLFFVYKLSALEKKINPAESSETTFLKTARSLVSRPAIKLKGIEKDRINILLLGIAGKGKPGQNLTDTIMIASVNPKTNQVALFSVPRDFYLKIPETDFQGKINSVYQYGLNTFKDSGRAASLVSRTIKDITSLDMDYYIVLNFNGFEKIIDSGGGINIMNERDIYDASYPGPNYSYETFKLTKGFHQLDGATALKYVRERHNDPEGDFGRAKRQQQVLQATKNKVFSTGTMLNVIALNNLFNALGEAIQTNIAPGEIGGFMELSKKLDTQNINNFVLDAWNKESLLKVTHIFYGSTRVFALQPRVGNYSEIQEVAENIFDLNKIKRRREAIAFEDASIGIVNQSGDYALTGKIKKLLGDNLNYKNVIMLNNPANIRAEKSIVYDLTNGTKPFTLDELVGKLPAAPAYEAALFLKPLLGDRKVDMVISLGKDLASIYNAEEGTLDDLNRANDIQENLEYNKN